MAQDLVDAACRRALAVVHGSDTDRRRAGYRPLEPAGGSLGDGLDVAVERLLDRYGDRIDDLTLIATPELPAARGRRVPRRRGRLRLHARGCAPARGRARPPHADLVRDARPRHAAVSRGGELMAGRSAGMTRRGRRAGRVARAACGRAGGRAEPERARRPRTACSSRARAVRVILALDQGTSSTRCVAFDRDLRELGRRRCPSRARSRDRARRAGPGRARRVRARGDRRRARERPGATRSRPSRSRTRPRPSWSGTARPAGRAPGHRLAGPPHATRPATARRASTSRSCASAPGSSSTRRSRPARSAGCSTASGARGGGLAYGDVASWLVHSLAGRRT